MKKPNMQKKKSEEMRKQMHSHLKKLRESGVELFVDGEAVPPKEAVRRTVCEDSSYMADYVFAENGSIRQVRFDKVSRG